MTINGVTKEQIDALVQLSKAVVEAVKEAGPQGAPAGPLYAALMSVGCTLHQFHQLMDMLVRLGRIRKSGHLYFVD